MLKELGAVPVKGESKFRLSNNFDAAAPRESRSKTAADEAIERQRNTQANSDHRRTSLSSSGDHQSPEATPQTVDVASDSDNREHPQANVQTATSDSRYKMWCGHVAGP
jgi:hypothetical protein